MEFHRIRFSAFTLGRAMPNVQHGASLRRALLRFKVVIRVAAPYVLP